MQPTVGRAHPQVAGAVFDERIDDILTETFQVNRVVFKNLEGITVITVQAVFGANPEITLAVLEDCFL